MSNKPTKPGQFKAPKAAQNEREADRLERHAFYQLNRLLELERGAKQ